jgi:hypothetical protein
MVLAIKARSCVTDACSAYSTTTRMNTVLNLS